MLLYKRIRFAERLHRYFWLPSISISLMARLIIVDAHLPENLLAGHQADNSFFRRRVRFEPHAAPSRSLRFLIGELKNLSLVEAVGDQQVDLPDFIGEPLLMAVQLRHEISQPAKGLMNLLDEWRVGR